MRNRNHGLKWLYCGAAFCAMSVLAACETVEFGDSGAVSQPPGQPGQSGKPGQQGPQAHPGQSGQPGTGGGSNGGGSNGGGGNNPGTGGNTGGSSNPGTGGGGNGGGSNGQPGNTGGSSNPGNVQPGQPGKANPPKTPAPAARKQPSQPGQSGQPGNGQPSNGQPGQSQQNQVPSQGDPQKGSQQAQSTPERKETSWRSTPDYMAEYDKSGIFARTNAKDGLPTGKVGGDGVVVGVVDSGIDFNHPDLKGAEAGKNPNPNITNQRHGTGVAGIIAARRNGYGMHGVAPYAKLVDLSTAGPYKNFESSDLAKAIGTENKFYQHKWAKSDIVNMSIAVGYNRIPPWAQTMREVAKKNIIMVISAGNWDSQISREKDKGWEKPDWLAAVVGALGIRGWAIAVGNLDANYGQDPNFQPKYYNFVLNGKLRKRSHFCGRNRDVQRYCIFAPGNRNYTTEKRDKYDAHGSGKEGNNYRLMGGTSAAAPVVSGYLANLMSAFPERRGQKWNVPTSDPSSYYNGANWYVARLLSTADNSGEYSQSEIYGVGVVDGTAALTPQGTTSAVTSSGHFTMAQTQAIGDMRLGPGMTDLGQAAALNQVLVYDEHRAPFLMNLQGRVARTQPSSSSYIADFVQRLSALDAEPTIAQQPLVPGMDMTFGFTLSQHQGLGKAYDTASLFDAAETPIALAATADPLAFSMGTRSAMGAAVSLSDTMSLAFSASSNRKPDESPDPSDAAFLLTQSEPHAHRAKFLGRLGLNYEGKYGAFQLQSGILHEKKGLFDTTGSDALAFAKDAQASYVQLGARIPLTDRIALLGSYTQGWAAVDEAGESMWRGHGDMRFNAFTLGARYKGLFDNTDKLSFTVGQPLRLTSGSVYLRKAPGESNGAAYLVDAPVDLSPKDRELMFQLAYEVDIARRARLSLGGYYRINPGHDRRQPDEFGIGTKFSMRF